MGSGNLKYISHAAVPPMAPGGKHRNHKPLATDVLSRWSRSLAGVKQGYSGDVLHAQLFTCPEKAQTRHCHVFSAVCRMLPSLPWPRVELQTSVQDWSPPSALGIVMNVRMTLGGWRPVFEGLVVGGSSSKPAQVQHLAGQ